MTRILEVQEDEESNRPQGGSSYVHFLFNMLAVQSISHTVQYVQPVFPAEGGQKVLETGGGARNR